MKRLILLVFLVVAAMLLFSCNRNKVVVVRVVDATYNGTVAGVKVVLIKNNFAEVFVNRADTLASVFTDANGEAVFEDVDRKSENGSLSFRAVNSTYFVASSYYGVPKKNQLEITIHPRYNLRCRLKSRGVFPFVSVFVSNSLNSESFQLDSSQFKYFQIALPANQESVISLSANTTGFFADSNFTVFAEPSDTLIRQLTLSPF